MKACMRHFGMIVRARIMDLRGFRQVLTMNENGFVRAGLREVC